MKKKVDKKVHVVKEKIAKLTKESTIDDCLLIKNLYQSLSHEQRFEIDNYGQVLLLEISINRNALDEIMPADVVAQVVDEQIEISHRMITKTDVSIVNKRQSAELARALFDALNMRYHLENKALLEKLESHMEYLEIQEVLREQALVVVELIDDLDVPISLAEVQAVVCVRKAYDELDPMARQYVYNLSVLEEIETIVACMERALAIDTMIYAIPNPITLDCEDSINQINEMVSSMSEKELAYLSAYRELDNANETIVQLKQIARDMDLAQAVDEQIAIAYNRVFNEQLTLEAKKHVFHLTVEIFNDLTDSQKEYVNNEELISLMSSEICRLDELHQRWISAHDVVELITKIPREITNKEYDYIFSIRKKYDKLDEQQVTVVTNASALFAAEDVICAQESGNEMDEQIRALKANLEFANQIETVYQKYITMSDLEKSYVKNHSLLEQMLFKTRQMIIAVESANAFDSALMDLPSKISIEDCGNVLVMKNRYDSLTDLEKSYVDKYYILEKLLHDVEVITFASKINEQFCKMPRKLRVSHLKEIEKMHVAAQEIDEEYLPSKLKICEAYIDLKKREERALSVFEMIEQIDEVEKHEGDDIAETRFAYELLAIDERELVANYSELVNMEREFLKLEVECQNEILDDKMETYVDEQINVLEKIFKNSDITIEKKRDLVCIVEDLYSSLTDSQKAYVENIHLLEELKKSA